MKIINFFYVILYLFLIIGCTESYRDIKYPDIKAMKTDKIEFLFDLREIKNKYGEPPIVDSSKKIVGYFAIYKYHFGYTYIDLEPSYMEYWYLLLTQTEDPNYFTGDRYYDYFQAINSTNEYGHKVFEKVKPLIEIEKIKKCRKAKPEFFDDKTKPVEYSYKKKN